MLYDFLCSQFILVVSELWSLFFPFVTDYASNLLVDIFESRKRVVQGIYGQSNCSLWTFRIVEWRRKLCLDLIAMFVAKNKVLLVK